MQKKKDVTSCSTAVSSSSLPLQEQEQLSYSSTRTKLPGVVVTGLKPGTLYVFRVRARTAAGYTAYCPKFEFATVEEGKARSLPRLSLNRLHHVYFGAIVRLSYYLLSFSNPADALIQWE